MHQQMKQLLSCSHLSKEIFSSKYSEIQVSQKANEFHILLLSEIEKSVVENNFNKLKNVCRIIKYINDLETCEVLKNYCKSDNNPIKNINLVILACKHNNVKLLKYILGDSDILHNFSIIIGQDTIAPNNEDDKCHNSFYYAIRSGNIDLLETLITKWPNKYFEHNLRELEENLSAAYAELKLKNVLLSKDIEVYVESKLLSLRFFSDTAEKTKDNKNFNTIKERILLVVEEIGSLVNEFNLNEINGKWLHMAKFVAQNIHILKRQLKSTYDQLPWEEIEFLLCVFVLSHMKQQEINLFNHVILKKDKIVSHLEKFGKKISEANIFEAVDICKLANLPRLKRDDAVKHIISTNPQFKELYEDYQQIRDIHTLFHINNYINLALSTNPKEKEGQIIIIRVLQVIGEYLKNTLEAPKLSSTTSEFILLSLPKNTRNIIIDLRNSLSHAYSLSKKIDIEKNMDIDFFIGIQNDVKKIGDVISDIIFSRKIKMIKVLLENIVNSENVDGIKNVIKIASCVKFDKIDKGSFEVAEGKRLKNLIVKLSAIICDKTIYEQQLFDKINAIITSSESSKVEKNQDFVLGLVSLKSLTETIKDCKIDNSIIRVIKFLANVTLKNISFEIESHSLKEITNFVTAICDSVTTRMQTNLEEVRRITLEIYSIAEFGMTNINWIEELREKLTKNDYFISSHKQKVVSLTEENCSKLLKYKILELETILNKNELGKSNKNIFLCINNKKLLAVLETLLLDIMSILDASKKYHLENNLLFLDDNAPLLTGKYLRNHLAHNNTIVDLLSDPSIAIILNAKMLISENIEREPKSFGKLVREDPIKLKYKHDKNLTAIINQMNMFTALEEGNMESLIICLKNGADINARTIDLWTALHFASKGPSLDIVKFVIGENLNLNVKNINGRNPLHIAAAHGRKDIVKFFVKSKGMALEEVDEFGKTPLHLAAQNGHTDTVATLLKNKADCYIHDICGISSLHYAIRNGHINTAKLLLENNINVDINEVMGGFTALHEAAERGNIILVELLLQKGANVNARNDRDWMPLHAASLNGHLDVVNTLILRGADVNSKVIDGCTPLHYAVENGHEMVVDVLLKHGGNVNAFDKTYHNTPLHYASKDGYRGIVKKLLKNKADVNAATIEGMTPLLFAAQAGHLEIVATLLECNLDVNSRNINNATALHYAAENGYTEIVDLLIKNGALINFKDNLDFAALHKAALKNRTDIVKLLIKNNAELCAKTGKGCSLLHVAVLANSMEVIDFLLKKGIDVDAQDNDGSTALHLAAANGYKDVITLLLKNNSDINSINAINMTPLHVALLAGHKDTINILIQNKADVNCIAREGYTSLHFAAFAGHKEVVEVLIKNGAQINVKYRNCESPLLTAVKINNKDIVNILLTNTVNMNDECQEAISIAVFAGFKDIVEILLKYNPLVNMKYDENATLMHIAAKRGHKEIVKTLILNGADVDSRTIQNATPLYFAAEGGHANIVEILVASKAAVNIKSNEGVTPLNIASTFGHSKVVDILLSNRANPNIRDNKNRSAVELAVAHGHFEIVKSLLHYKVDVNAKGNDDRTLLHIAAQENNLEIIRYLVNKGCDIHAENASGSKPVHIAAKEGFKNIVEFFLNKGCSLNDFGVAKQTLLHYAAMSSQIEVVQYLIIKGADVNSKDANGVTPLFLAANCGNRDIIKLLLNGGADYNIVDKLNRKASEFATDEDVVNVLKFTENLFKAVKHNSLSETENCINSGAVINAKNAECGTPLHFAAYKGYLEIVQVLLKNKSNPNVVSSKGFTPLHYASKFSHLNVVVTLLSNGAIFDAVSDSGKTPVDLAVDQAIITLLRYVSDVFVKIENNNSKVVNDLGKKDINTVKAVLNARNRDSQTLVVFALLNSFSRVEELKAILQGDVKSEIERALSFLNKSSYLKALTLFNSILEKRKDILGPDNPGTLDIQMYIAKVLYKQGAYAEALGMLEEILPKMKEMLGLDNKHTLSLRSFIALILHRLGRDEESLVVHQEVHRKQLELLGPDDNDTLDTQLHMALVLDRLEKFDEALLNNRQVYERRKKANHPAAIPAQNNIALVLTNQGKYDEALKIYKKVLQMKKLFFGVNHADTLRTSHNIAGILMKQKKYPDALKAFKELLSVQTSILGAIHPDTLNTQFNMGNVLFAQGKWIGAFKVFKQNLELRKAIWGANHPSVLDILQKFKLINLRLKMEGSNESEILQYLQKDIIIASNDGDTQAVKYLLKNGADVNEKDVEGRTPLHFAASNGHADIVKILLENGGDCTLITNKGNTPLHTAASKGYEEISKLLLQHTSNVKLNDLLNSATTVGKNTSLHVAAKNGSCGIVLFLLRHGAIYNIKNKDGKLPFDLSTDLHVSNILRLLGELFEYAKKGNVLIINKLKTAKPEEISAITNARNNQGKTLLQVVISNKHQNIAKELLKMLQSF